MAQFYTDFSEYPLAAPPDDWSAPWSAFTSSIADESFTDGHALYSPNTAGGNSLLKWDALSDVADIEVLTKARVTVTSGSSVQMGVAVRTSGANNNRSGYMVGMLGQNGNFRMMKAVNGAATNALATSTMSLTIDTWYFIRVRAVGTSIRAKIWQDGSPEPAFWHIDIVDSDVASGGAGAFFVGNTAGGTYWDMFSVGTDGDPAPSEPLAGDTPFKRYTGTEWVNLTMNVIK